MKFKKLLLLLLFGMAVSLFSMFSCLSETSPHKQRVCIQQIYGFPAEEPGYEAGVSAAYAGVIGHRLVLAGGCNFAGKPAAEGGAKQFYKGIYVAEMTDDTVLVWKKAGELPVPAAYGASVTLSDGKIILIGGNNAEGGLSAVYSLRLNDSGEAVLDTLPSLPMTIDNMAAAVMNHTLYVAGGNAGAQSPVCNRPSSASRPSASASAVCPTTTVLSFNLDHPEAGWQEELSFPGPPRVQPVCAVQDGMLYVWGGFSPPLDSLKATVSTAGYRYLPVQKKWEPVPAPVVPKTGETLTLTGGTAIACSDSLIVCAGGVDKDIFLDAISGGYRRVAKDEYLRQPVEWYQFNRRLMAYDTRRNQWDEWTTDARLARAGAVLLSSEHGMYLIGGETKPGIRTAEIVRINLIPASR